MFLNEWTEQKSTTILTERAFDPYHQSITFLDVDGTTAITSSISQVQSVINNVAIQGVIWGTQVGATIIMMVMLLLMTRREKRRSWVFILNLSALISDTIRSALQCAQLTSAFFNFFNYSAAYYGGPGIVQAQAFSVTSNVFTVLAVAIMEAALVCQVHVVCVTMLRNRRLMVTIAGIIVAMMAIGFRFALVVVNCDQAVHINNSTVASVDYLNWIASSTNITQVVSIAYFSTVFCCKLAFAIRSRHQLGMKQFGPMQIIFIMGCQTLVIPLIFAVITYYAVPGTQINSFVVTIVVIFLPLSGMWAAANTSNREPRNVDRGNIIPYGWNTDTNGTARSRDAHTSFATDKNLMSASDTADTLVASNNMSSICSTPLKSTYGSVVGRKSGSAGARQAGRMSDEIDLELQEIAGNNITGNNIQVDRSYSVQSAHGRF